MGKAQCGVTMGIKDIFVRNLKAYRKNKGVSQMKLAELCGSSTSYIGQIEIGNKFPSIDMIEKIASALEIKPYQLFFDSGDASFTDVSQPSAQFRLSKSYKTELLRDISAAINRVLRKR